MILISKIEYMETDRDPHQIIHCTSPYEGVAVNTDHGKDIVECNELIELVNGVRFCRYGTDDEIVIGMSKQAQDLIGIQYESWENKEKEYSELYSSFTKARNEISFIKNAGLLRRLSWLFFGYKQ